MLKIPYDQIITKIKEESSLSEAEIETKVQEKMKQLSGLISKEGAAHIVANELGTKLIEDVAGTLQIKNIVSGLRNVETVGKVIQTYPLREFNTEKRSGKVASFMMGDETGNIRVVMWNEQADVITTIQDGTIVKVVGSYVRENNGFNELHVNERSKIILNPEGITVEPKQRSAAERKNIQQLTEADSSAEILGTIVQVFDPRFYPVDPESGRKVTEKEGAFYLNDKLVENPTHSYVMNIVLDDGTETMRTVFFKETGEKLTSKSKEEMLRVKEQPELFDAVKNDLLGNIIKVNGRVKKNLFFDRLEFVANEVVVNPDPQEELKRLEESKPSE